MKTKLFITLFFLLILSSLKIYSQDKDEKHFYEMNFLPVPYDRINELMDFYETNFKQLDAENENILSIKIFRHVSGPMWSICILTEYKDMEGFVAAQKRGDEIFMKMFPDKSKGDELMKKFASFLTGHTDALVTDNPKYEKKK